MKYLLTLSHLKLYNILFWLISLGKKSGMPQKNLKTGLNIEKPATWQPYSL
jgi:hypothetical protein